MVVGAENSCTDKLDPRYRNLYSALQKHGRKSPQISKCLAPSYSRLASTTVALTGAKKGATSLGSTRRVRVWQPKKQLSRKEEGVKNERKDMESPCCRRSRSSLDTTPPKTGQKFCSFVEMFVFSTSMSMPLPPSGAAAWVHGSAEASTYITTSSSYTAAV